MPKGSSYADKYRKLEMGLPNIIFRIIDSYRCRHFCAGTGLPVKLNCKTTLKKKDACTWIVSGTIEPDNHPTRYGIEIVSATDSATYDLKTFENTDRIEFSVSIKATTGKKLKVFLTTREYSPYLNRRSFVGTIPPNDKIQGYCVNFTEGAVQVYDGGDTGLSGCRCAAYATHNWGGGAAEYLKKKISSDIAAGIMPLTISRMSGSYVVRIHSQAGCDAWIMDDGDALEHFLMTLTIDSITVNELVSFENLEEILDILKNVSEKKKARSIMLVHDYHCIHPSFLLLDAFGKTFDPSSDVCNTPEIAKWRGLWKKFLSSCNEVVTFSESSAKILTSVYGPMDNLIVRPHTVEDMRTVSPHEPGARMNIAVIGDLMPQKGSNIVLEMCRIIKERGLEINIFHYGTTYLPPISDLHEHGRYNRNELPDLMMKDCIDVVLIPSIWPETFSYTTEEAMMMDMPVAVFDMGAPAERVREYYKGIIIPEVSAKSALETLMESFSGQPLFQKRP